MRDDIFMMMHMEKNAKPLQEGLKFNPEDARARIVDFVRREVDYFKKSGVIVGLSGGLDSSTVAYLCVEALGKDRVMGLILPDRDSSPENTEDGMKLADSLGIRHQKIDISPILRDMGAYQLLPQNITSSRTAMESSLQRIKRMTGKESTFAESFSSIYAGIKREGFVNVMHAFMTAKTRVRMILLYFHGTLMDQLVVGTDDKTELTIGFYDKYGDGACDISLLSHLYKTQIKKLASHIGVPPHIVNKPSSHDLWGHNLPNEELIGLSYEILDGILYGMEAGLSDGEIAGQSGVRLETIESIKHAIRTERVRRSLPISL